MKRLIAFYAYEPEYKSKDILYGYYETMKAIKGLGTVITGQMACLSMDLFSHYNFTDILIHQTPNDTIEIHFDKDSNEITCDRTDKQLRLAHNLEKLWKAGAFNKVEEVAI